MVKLLTQTCALGIYDLVQHLNLATNIIFLCTGDMLGESVPGQEDFHFEIASLLLDISLNTTDVSILNKPGESIEPGHARLSKIVQERKVIHISF